MTVAELIEELKKWPPDTVVFSGDMCEDAMPIEGISEYFGGIGSGEGIRL